MCLQHFGVGPPLLLPLGSLPAPHEPQAFRVLAVALVPAAGLIDVTAPLAQTITGSKPTAASRVRGMESMLEMSQGRVCSRRGRPRDSAKVSRAPSSYSPRPHWTSGHFPSVITLRRAPKNSSLGKHDQTLARREKGKKTRKETEQIFLARGRRPAEKETHQEEEVNREVDC